MNKTLICCLLLAIVLGMALSVNAEEQAQITVQPSIESGQLKAKVLAQLPEAVAAAGIEFTLRYNPSELAFAGIKPGAMLAEKNVLIRASINHATGFIHCSAVVLGKEEAFYGGGTVFELDFRLKQDGRLTLGFDEEACILGAWGGSRIKCQWSAAEIMVPDSQVLSDSRDDGQPGPVTDNIQYTTGKVRIQRLVTIDQEQLDGLMQAQDDSDVLRVVLAETAPLQEYYGLSAAVVSAVQILSEAAELLADRELVVAAPDGSCLVLSREALQSAIAQGELKVEHSSVPVAAVQELIDSGVKVVSAINWRWNGSGAVALWFPLSEQPFGSNVTVCALYNDASQDRLMPGQVKEGGRDYAKVAVTGPGTYVLCEERLARELVLQIGSREMVVNGRTQEFDAAPYINPLASRTMVPVRFVSEGLGAQVDWLPSTRQIRIIDGGTEVLLTIDSVRVRVGNQELEIDCPPVIQGNRTFVPLRFVSEVLGAQVEYKAKSKLIRVLR